MTSASCWVTVDIVSNKQYSSHGSRQCYQVIIARSVFLFLLFEEGNGGAFLLSCLPAIVYSLGLNTSDQVRSGTAPAWGGGLPAVCRRMIDNSQTLPLALIGCVDLGANQIRATGCFELLQHVCMIGHVVCVCSVFPKYCACVVKWTRLSCVTSLLHTLIDPPHLSHISLVSSAWFPVSLHLHLIPSLVYFVLKPALFLSLFVGSSVQISSSRRSCCHLAFLCLFPFLLCSLCSACFPLGFMVCSLFLFHS